MKEEHDSLDLMKRYGLGKFVTQAQAIWELEKKMDVLKRRRRRRKRRRKRRRCRRSGGGGHGGRDRAHRLLRGPAPFIFLIYSANK